MSDIGINLPPVGYALLVLFVAAPWYLSGAAIGALLWRVLFVRRWWIGGLIGAVVGGLVWASTIPVW